MPELPEVEVTRRRIAPLLLGRRIADVETTGPSYLYVTDPADVTRALVGQTPRALGRAGKYLCLELADASRLVIHLGMSGQLFSAAATSVRLLAASARGALLPEKQRAFVPDAHTHLRIHFSDGGPAVFLRDVRKLGKVLWVPAGADHPRLARLGLDALELSGEVLYAATRGRTIAIKALLLDQAVVAGIGNIYADEALFYAGIRPTRRAHRVTRPECDRLADCVRRVLLRSIETGGSSIRDFVAPDGSDGHFQDERAAYGRTGQPCPRCQAPIQRRVVAQRSAHFCRRCQR
jgi:formamidopyrimidine-DNA glycosylase